jgi:hypothetical protein
MNAEAKLVYVKIMGAVLVKDEDADVIQFCDHVPRLFGSDADSVKDLDFSKIAILKTAFFSTKQLGILVSGAAATSLRKRCLCS